MEEKPWTKNVSDAHHYKEWHSRCGFDSENQATTMPLLLWSWFVIFLTARPLPGPVVVLHYWTWHHSNVLSSYKLVDFKREIEKYQKF